MRDRRWNGALRSSDVWATFLLTGLAVAGSQPSTASSHAMSAADQRPGTVRAPVQAVDMHPHSGIFETLLVAREATVYLGAGVHAKAVTFNGTVPGPEIRVKVGDRVIVHFRNELPEGFSIHWHGIELNNASDGTGLTQNAVKTGETFVYRFVVPRPGIFFYHSHFEPTNPEFKGFYGTIIVEDPAEETLRQAGVLPALLETFSLVLSDTTVCKAPGANDAVTYPADPGLPWVGTEEGLGLFPGNSFPRTPRALCEDPIDHHGHLSPDPVPLPEGSIPNIQPSHDPPCAAGCRTLEGQIVLTNGQITAPRAGSPTSPGAMGTGEHIFAVKGGAGVRLQLTSATVARYLRLRLTGQNGAHLPLYRVGGQGGLLDHVRLEGGIVGNGFDTLYTRGEILLAAGERADLVFVMPRTAHGDILTLWTQDYRRTGEGYSRLPSVPVAHFRITGATEDSTSFAIYDGAPLLRHPSVNRLTETLVHETPTPLVNPAALGVPGTANPVIRLTTVGLPAIDLVDGFIFDMGAPDFTTVPHIASSRFALAGTVTELTVANTSLAHHPWHFHGFSMQPLRIIKCVQPAGAGFCSGDVTGAGGEVVYEFDYNEFVDTFDVAPNHAVTFRLRLDDRVLTDFVSPGGHIGRWAYHCHIFFHAGLGMVAEFVVLPEHALSMAAAGRLSFPIVRLEPQTDARLAADRTSR